MLINIKLPDEITADQVVQVLKVLGLDHLEAGGADIGSVHIYGYTVTIKARTDDGTDLSHQWRIAD